MTREAAEQEFQYDKFPRAVCSKPEMLFDISPLMERPLVLDTVTWSTTNPRFSVLKVYTLMNDFFTSTPTLRNYLLNYSYFRCHACAYVTVTGTINHQGILLASVIPNLYSYVGSTNKGSMVNLLMTAPHAVLGANEATSACIEIPFYVASDYLTLDATYTNDPSNPDISLPGKNNYADLILYVLNPLAVSGTTSTSVSVHVQIKINKLEVYTQTPSTVNYVAYPTFTAEMLGRVVTNTFDKAADLMKTTSSDFIDALRSLTKQYTGLHNPNNPVLEAPHYMQMRNRANIVDAPSFYEKMDPYSKYTRLTKDSIFHSTIDEMDMSYILSKPQYIGTFEVGSANTTGTLLWSRPISPWQGGCFNGQALTSNIERLYYNTQAWSGDMELVIQSSMTNKQNLKLLVAKVYGLDRRLINTYPDYASARTGITSLLEFSAGNQQLVVDLDFLSRNQILYNTIDSAANALQHGMYYIFLAQPLVVADSVPASVEFNVFLRCKDNFRYYGYGYRPGYTSSRTTNGPFIPTPALLSIKEEQNEEDEFTTFTAESDAAKVMNEPSSNSELNHVDHDSTTPLLNTVERMYPISNIRDLIRRVQYIGKYSATADASGVYSLQIPISALAGLFPTAPTEESPNQSLFKMYGGLNLGLRLKIRSFDSSNFFVQYYPPTLVSAYSSIPEDASGVFYSNVVTPSSPYVNLVTGPVTGATYMELPTSWTADIKAGESGSVMDLHIPHTTIFHWWSSSAWSSAPGPNFENYKSALNNNGYLLISGVASPNGIADFEMFAGADDETRLGYHTVAPILFLPLTANKLQYALPERVPVSTTSSAIAVTLRPCYYSNLVTSYHTAL